MTWSLLFLPAAGFFVGAVASLTGVGGGIFIVPLLIALFRFIPQHAVGTSLTSIIFTAAAAAYFYAGQKRIFFRVGLVLAVTSIPGAYLGAYLTSVIPPRLLGLTFGIFLLLISVRMILQKGGEARIGSLAPAEKPDLELIKSPGLLAAGSGLSFFAGLSSGFLGIGGGVLSVPVMNQVMGMPIHYATATSMFTMVFTSLAGVAKHALFHHVHLTPALLLALGTIFGAQAGTKLSLRFSGLSLRRVFGTVLLAMSLQMIWRFV
ncbi:MAG: sulfite exporter TauE/SafE family protein [Acidobacteriota bacterium]